MEVRDEEKLGYCDSADHTESGRRRGGRELQTLNPPPAPPHVYYLQHLQPNRPIRKDLNPDPDSDPVSDQVSSATAPLKRSTNVGRPQSPLPSAAPPSGTNTMVVRYRECRKNHAASNGGHVVDGCGEFMPSGEEGTPEGLRCAACECHRSFHRKVIEEDHMNPNFSFHNIISQIGRNPQRNNSNTQHQTPLHDYLPQPQHQRPSLNRHVSPIMVSFGVPGGGGQAESSTENLDINGVNQQQKTKKRFRTKFNKEQKERMMEFAERLGWRMGKEDEEEVRRFCSEVDIKRQVLKVWMHNNKQATKRKQT